MPNGRQLFFISLHPNYRRLPLNYPYESKVRDKLFSRVAGMGKIISESLFFLNPYKKPNDLQIIALPEFAWRSQRHDNHALPLSAFQPSTPLPPLKVLKWYVLNPFFQHLNHAICSQTTSDQRRNLCVVAGTIPFHMEPILHNKFEGEFMKYFYMPTVPIINISPILIYDSNGNYLKSRWTIKENISLCDYTYSGDISKPNDCVPEIHLSTSEMINFRRRAYLDSAIRHLDFTMDDLVKDMPGSPFFSLPWLHTAIVQICLDFVHGSAKCSHYYKQYGKVPLSILISSGAHPNDTKNHIVHPNGLILACDQKNLNESGIFTKKNDVLQKITPFREQREIHLNTSIFKQPIYDITGGTCIISGIHATCLEFPLIPYTAAKNSQIFSPAK